MVEKDSDDTLLPHQAKKHKIHCSFFHVASLSLIFILSTCLLWALIFCQLLSSTSSLLASQDVMQHYTQSLERRRVGKSSQSQQQQHQHEGHKKGGNIEYGIGDVVEVLYRSYGVVGEIGEASMVSCGSQWLCRHWPGAETPIGWKWRLCQSAARLSGVWKGVRVKKKARNLGSL